jgi:hypothetical protein
MNAKYEFSEVQSRINHLLLRTPRDQQTKAWEALYYAQPNTSEAQVAGYRRKFDAYHQEGIGEYLTSIEGLVNEMARLAEIVLAEKSAPKVKRQVVSDSGHYNYPTEPGRLPARSLRQRHPTSVRQGVPSGAENSENPPALFSRHSLGWLARLHHQPGRQAHPRSFLQSFPRPLALNIHAMKYTTTLAQIRKHDPCAPGWRKLVTHLGAGYPEDQPIELSTILKSNGWRDAVWALRSVPGIDEDARLFACDCAERVLPEFESMYPDDKRPRKAIETARLFAEGKASSEDLKIARAAAASASASASADAAFAASASAYAAADDAFAASASASASADAAFAASASASAYASADAAFAAYASADAANVESLFTQRFCN